MSEPFFTSSRTDAEDALQEIFIDLGSSGRYDSAKASETTFVREPSMEELLVVAPVDA